MFLGFDFYRDNTLPDLEERVKRINTFLATRVSSCAHHRHFGVFLLTPTDSTHNPNLSEKSTLKFKQLKNHYSIIFQFFDDNLNSLENCELFFDLGSSPSIYKKSYTDVLALSYLSSLSLRGVEFTLSPNSISVLVKFDDDDSRIVQVKKHLEFIIPGIPIPEN